MRFGALLTNKGIDYFYIMHLSYNGTNKSNLWNYASENNLIGLDVPGIVRANWLTVRENAKRALGKGWTNQFDTFCSRMKRNDVVMIFDGMSSILGVAEIEKATHEYDRTLSQRRVFFDHIRDVRWIRKNDFKNPIRLRSPLYGFRNTLTIVPRSSPRWPILADIEI
jgi:hypothetical protein